MKGEPIKYFVIQMCASQSEAKNKTTQDLQRPRVVTKWWRMDGWILNYFSFNIQFSSWMLQKLMIDS